MRSSKTWLVFPFLAFATVLMDCSCDFFGATGGLFVPESKEVQLGRTFDSTLQHNDTARQQFPRFDTRGDAARIDLKNYFDSLSRIVLAAVPEDEMPGYGFTFTLIDDTVENAFAVPGGYVYVYTGIIRKMNDESELAGVLGHEIAHVTWHHYRDALAKQAGMGILLDALLGNDAGKLAQLVAGSLFQLAALKVTRSNEAEADHYGTIYCGRAGRNPLGIAKYFSRSHAGGIPEWLSSHPGSDKRVEEVSAQVNASPNLKTLAADSATTNFTTRFLTSTRAVR